MNATVEEIKQMLSTPSDKLKTATLTSMEKQDSGLMQDLVESGEVRRGSGREF